MEFLTGTGLTSAIKKVAQGVKPRFAVAFWGKGSLKLIDKTKNKEVRIICNLKSGGTNPKVIKKLLAHEINVRQHNTLHAKIYFNNTHAIVTSANASANGLGLEGNEQGHWEEAGILIDNLDVIAKIEHWFARMWEDESKKITLEDIEQAEQNRIVLQRGEPPLKSFAKFDVNIAEFPLLDCYDDSLDFDLSKGQTRDLSEKQTNRLHDRFEDGIDLENYDKDGPVIRKHKWVVFFRKTKNNMPASNLNLCWTNLGEPEKKAIKYKGDTKYKDAAPAADAPGNEPFEIELDKEFKALFRQVISRLEFKELMIDQDKVSYPDERLKLIQKFWTVMHEEYVSQRSSK